MLFVWLGVLIGFKVVLDKYGIEIFYEMSLKWFFFCVWLEMLEMVFSKVDSWLSVYYDDVLVIE